jgi:hypothetical protein
MASGFVNDPGDIFLRVAVAIDQLSIAFGFLNCVQVLALDILDQRDLGRGRLVEFANKRGDRVQPRPLCRPPSAFAGDDLITFAIPMWPQQDRLEYTALGDRIRELVDRLLTELDTRLIGVRTNSPDFNLTDSLRGCSSLSGGRRPGGLSEKGLESHSEPFSRLFAHAASANWGKRPMSSRANRI